MFNLINSLPMPAYLILILFGIIFLIAGIKNLNKQSKRPLTCFLYILLAGAPVIVADRFLTEYAFGTIAQIIINYAGWVYFFIFLTSIIITGILEIKRGYMSDEAKKVFLPAIGILIIMMFIIGIIMVIEKVM